MKELAEMEGAVSRIRSVLGARIISDEKGEISEVHILASDERNPKQIVRDTESTLLVKFGRRVDHKKIGVVQQNLADIGAAKETRLKIKAVRTHIVDQQTQAEVVLVTAGGQEFLGLSGVGPAEPLQGFAQAALAAVNDFLGTERFISQEVYRIGSVEPAIISLVGDRGFRETLSLAGASLIRDNEEESVVKATLAAINRAIGRPIKK
ncbi:MAG: hypothetical protein NTU59_00170 [Coprothermobacterota bacterium]|nr:hypothetical protein [Coprothermobacterota bacterium]